MTACIPSSFLATWLRGSAFKEFAVLCRYDSRRLLLFLDVQYGSTSPWHLPGESSSKFHFRARRCILDQVIEEFMLAHLCK